MALSHSLQRTSIGTVDAGAGDGDCSCVNAIDGFGDGGHAGFVGRVRDAREPAQIFVVSGCPLGEVAGFAIW
jgi:predicted RNase H-like HicB family nuclease